MAKAYWIGRVSITDPDTYPHYVAAAAAAFRKYSARFLVRGGNYEAIEGEARARNVVIEFDSFEDALACYRSEKYQAAAAIRKSCAEGELVIVEGMA